MYKDDRKDENGQYSAANFLRRAMELTSWSFFKKYAKNHIPEYGMFKVGLLYVDYLGCIVKYGAAVTDYFQYRFWEKKACMRKNYVTKMYSRKIQKILNKPEGIGFLYNKLKFNKEYAKFRDTRHFEFPGTEESFLEFVKNCNRKIIAKPIYGSSGGGIYIPDVSTDDKAREVYAKHCNDGVYFVEELFIQTGPLGKINPTSVNTVRIYTVFDGKEVHIMNTFVRFGAPGSFVDNTHNGGMICEVDLKSGVIIGQGVDLLNNRYAYHSASNLLVVGVQVPQWDRVIRTVKEAALVHPEVGYAGWDIAVSEDKVTIIEANEQGNFSGPQRTAQRGLKPEYNAVLALRKKNLSI